MQYEPPISSPPGPPPPAPESHLWTLIVLLIAVSALTLSLALVIRTVDYEVIPIERPPRPEPKEFEERPDRLTLRAAGFADLPGWGLDSLGEALPAMVATCSTWRRRKPSTIGEGPLASTWEDWRQVCDSLQSTELTATGLRELLEGELVPVALGNHGEAPGLFTGYYQASLRGSRRRHGPYQTPLHSRPPELVAVDLGAFREEFAGQRIAGRVRGNRLEPFEDRETILAGSLAHRGLEILWVDDPVDAFFLHIQGSGIVEMEDGSLVGVGYAGQNGHPYRAIGRDLIDRGEIPREEMSMQAIRRWLQENPGAGVELMNSNASYIFMREVEHRGAIGSMGLALTPERSLAVDRRFLPLGLPLWLTAEAPSERESPLQRLVVAQDTGGAIRGPVRGDLFWGHGERAAALAGPMKSTGRLWALLPQRLVDRVLSGLDNGSGPLDVHEGTGSDGVETR